MSASPLSPVANGLKVAIRLTPKASRDRVDGVVAEADGGAVLKVSVTAVPEDGKANAALIALLSKQWKVPKSSLDIVHGATDRRKVILITGDAAALAARLEQWMARLT
ncbi:MAG: DUF167 domain-containing protein [Magnetospirillum sp.]|nr:DUF167 domain-containing protein [Magnetospirillum sp.]